jgi:predicted nucleic acid-binding protein
MILLDTNVLSELMRPEPHAGVLRWIDAQLPRELFISAVTRAEMEYGLALLPAGRRKDCLRAGTAQMFAEFSGRCLPFDERAATYYGTLVTARVRAGRPIEVEDGQIAAIALARGLTLATRNTGDFADIDGLKLVDPFAE